MGLGTSSSCRGESTRPYSAPRQIQRQEPAQDVLIQCHLGVAGPAVSLRDRQGNGNISTVASTCAGIKVSALRCIHPVRCELGEFYLPHRDGLGEAWVLAIKAASSPVVARSRNQGGLRRVPSSVHRNWRRDWDPSSSAQPAGSRRIHAISQAWGC
jgi:hypothetical protein